MKDFTVRIRRHRKRECYRAVVELEAKGYECVYPITPFEKYRKDFKYKDGNHVPYAYDGIDGTSGFIAVMRKKGAAASG